MIRLKKLKIEDVIPFATTEPIKKEYFGHLVKMDSDRYQTFKHSGVICKHCGLVASYFAMERHKEHNTYHFNLYGEKDGEEILFTKDHIIAKSKGGKDDISNYQTMCIKCNMLKRDNERIITRSVVYEYIKENIGEIKNITQLSKLLKQYAQDYHLSKNTEIRSKYKKLKERHHKLLIKSKSHTSHSKH